MSDVYSSEQRLGFYGAPKLLSRKCLICGNSIIVHRDAVLHGLCWGCVDRLRCGSRLVRWLRWIL